MGRAENRLSRKETNRVVKNARIALNAIKRLDIGDQYDALATALLHIEDNYRKRGQEPPEQVEYRAKEYKLAGNLPQQFCYCKRCSMGEKAEGIERATVCKHYKYADTGAPLIMGEFDGCTVGIPKKEYE